MTDKTIITVAPPPPSGVKIRTMRSDLESMRKSGGGMPTFQNVAVSGLSLEKGYRPPTQAPVQAPQASAPAQAPVAPRLVTAPVPMPPPQAMEKPQDVSVNPSSNNFLPVLIVIIVAILAIAGVGYFAYITFFK